MTQRDRYSCQTRLPGVGVDGQKKLAAASVLVVGAGGLGCPAMQYLAAAGIGRIGIVDFDAVDLSNLQRQILYTTADVGKPKAQVAKDTLLKLNPEIKVEAFAQRLSPENASSLMAAYDVILDGTDNFDTKYLINDTAVRLGKPVVFGAVDGFEGQVSVFGHNSGPCYRCLYPAPPSVAVMACADNGVLGTVTGIIGAGQASEAIKIILGHGSFDTLAGRLWKIDVATMDTSVFQIHRQKNCPVCADGTGRPAKNASPVCYAGMIEELDADDLRPTDILIDVREQHEWDNGHIPGARHIPLSLLRQNPDTFAPSSGARHVFYCQRGMRSRQAIEILAGTGHENIFSLRGGYDAY